MTATVTATVTAVSCLTIPQNIVENFHELIADSDAEQFCASFHTGN